MGIEVSVNKNSVRETLGDSQYKIKRRRVGGWTKVQNYTVFERLVDILFAT